MRREARRRKGRREKSRSEHGVGLGLVASIPEDVCAGARHDHVHPVSPSRKDFSFVSNNWKLQPEADWEALDPPDYGGAPSFVSGDPDSNRMRVRYFKRGRDGALVGMAWFGAGAQGPPGFAHGGSVAALLDEATGGAGWLAGYSVLAARLLVHFRARLPLETEVLFEARVTGVEARKVSAVGCIMGTDGTLFAEAENLLVSLDPEEFGAANDRVAERLWRKR